MEDGQMKTLLFWIFLCVAILAVPFAADSPPEEAWSGPVYEYASVRWMGDKTSIIWPDGRVQKVIPFGGRKRPDATDERMWYLAGAMNIMGKKGFELAHMSNDDLVMKRLGPKTRD